MFEERKIIHYLMDYHASKELTHQEKIDAVKIGVERGKFFVFVQEKLFGKGFTTITEETTDEWRKIRYIVDECIEDGYLSQKEIFSPGTGVYSTTSKTIRKVLEGEYLLLTSKGKKLARRSYFYLKFLPEEFGDLKIIFITFIGTVLASPIWRPVLSWGADIIKNIFTKLI